MAAGNLFLSQDWQAVGYDLPYAYVGMAEEGELASVLGALGPGTRVLAVHHVADVARGLHSVKTCFKARFTPITKCHQQQLAFEGPSVAEMVRAFYQVVHYATD
jgi:hypothetical protein